MKPELSELFGVRDVRITFCDEEETEEETGELHEGTSLVYDLQLPDREVIVGKLWMLAEYVRLNCSRNRAIHSGTVLMPSSLIHFNSMEVPSPGK